MYGNKNSQKVDDGFRNERTERITTYILAVAWSIVILVLLNFFYQYIAYYQLEKAGDGTSWVRYPVLTNDFRAWLPVLTVTLVLSIIGNAMLIFYDKHVLREGTRIVLNLLRIAAIVTLLVIFPFNFNSIPDGSFAIVLPLIVTVSLATMVAGLGIITLSGLIKLLINMTTGRSLIKT